MHRSTTTVVTTLLVVAAASPLQAQPRGDTLATLSRAAALVRALGPELGPAIWPGFRPDTVPLVFVLPGSGSLLAGWPGPLPEGFAPLPGAPGLGWRGESARGAASTGTSLGGRGAAQVVASSLDPACLVPTAVHEAFHLFERARVRRGRRFGAGESSAYVSRYPVQDVQAEADFALEGRVLAAALSAPSRAAALRGARELVAVRERRHRRIPSEAAEFDRMAELNEGLAEYALVRTLQRLARDPDPAVAAAARRKLAEHRSRLERLTEDVRQSPRLRFYATGPAMALLLDRLEGSGWKQRLVDEDLTLQDAVARAAGYREAETMLRAAALRRHGGPRLTAEAAARVARLQALRQAQADSVLARPGVLLVIDAHAMAQRDVGICGFDPQNLFRVSATVELHMRWLRPCNTSSTFGEISTATVHDEQAGTMAAVVGAEPDLHLTVGGRERTLADGERIEGASDVKIVTPVITYQAGRATLARTGRTLRVTLIP